MITYKNILETDEETRENVRLWRNSPRVRDRMLDQSEISPARHRQWLDGLAEKAGLNMVRVAFSGGPPFGAVPFGTIALRNIDWAAGVCDWGFYIGDESFLGRKLGRRLLYDLYDWGFLEAGVRKMHSMVRGDNLSALSEMLAAGSHAEGFLKEHTLASGRELVGIYMIAQFKDEWLKNREKISSWAAIGERGTQWKK